MTDDQLTARILREVADALELGNPPQSRLRERAEALAPTRRLTVMRCPACGHDFASSRSRDVVCPECDHTFNRSPVG